MKNVSILVPETAVIEAVADPHYMFKAVNQFLQASGKEPMFNSVQLVAVNKEVKLENSLFTVHIDKLLNDVKKTDLVFIPALSGDIEKALALNKELVPGLLINIIKVQSLRRFVLALFCLHQQDC